MVSKALAVHPSSQRDNLSRMGIVKNPWNLNGSKGSFLFKNNPKIQNINILLMIKKHRFGLTAESVLSFVLLYRVLAFGLLLLYNLLL